MTGILEGITVVDWTVLQAGPFATGMLADMGADVIHLEDRDRGDHTRWQRGPSAYREGRNVHFEEHNRNKRGIAVDLRKPEGRAVIYRLIKTADVFATNIRQKAIENLGMDYETLKRHNPKLIYAQSTPFGRYGPDADLASFDLSGQARAGLMMASGFEGDPPTPLVIGICDRITAFIFAHGILGALLARERFGISQYVHSSLLGASLVARGFTAISSLLTDAPSSRANRRSTPLSSSYKCKDGRWVMLAVIYDHLWDQAVSLLADSRLADTRFATRESRQEHAAELGMVLEEVFMKKTAQEWQDAVRAKAPDLFFSICNTDSDLPNDPQLVLNNYITDWDHPVWGPVKWIGFPVDWSETPASLRSPAPDFAQHTEEVLLEIGYTWDDIRRLQDAGAI